MPPDRAAAALCTLRDCRSDMMQRVNTCPVEPADGHSHSHYDHAGGLHPNSAAGGTGGASAGNASGMMLGHSESSLASNMSRADSTLSGFSDDGEQVRRGAGRGRWRGRIEGRVASMAGSHGWRGRIVGGVA